MTDSPDPLPLALRRRQERSVDARHRCRFLTVELVCGCENRVAAWVALAGILAALALAAVQWWAL